MLLPMSWHPPFTRLALAGFLDDIDLGSGALTYVPGSHRRHFKNASNTRPPGYKEIAAASYTPVSVHAGDALFRVPEVWHAVNPIHRLRRYAAASFTVRGTVSAEMDTRRAATRETRRSIDPDLIPHRVQKLWQ